MHLELPFVAARCCVAVTFAAHVLALYIGHGDALASPISELSRGNGAALHNLGLAALALAWLLIGAALWPREHRRLWRTGCALLLGAAPILLGVAVYFSVASDEQLRGPEANDPLAVLASILGVAMGALQPGLRRHSTAVARLNLWILALWMALVPVIPLVTDLWLGGYERTVGVLMLLWTFALTGIGPPGSYTAAQDQRR